MSTTIIVALLATVTAIITAIITDFLNKRSKLNFEERKLKEQYYLEYIHALSENMNNSGDDEAVIRYNHAFNNLSIIASPKVLSLLYQFSDLQISYLKGNAIVNYRTQYTKAFTDLVKEMRVDLYAGKTRKINEGLPEIYLISGILRSTSAK